MYNPYLDKQAQQKRRMTAKDYIEREDKFPHPARQTMYHISSTVHRPVFEVVYLDEAEAKQWKAKHISKLKKDEWFKTPKLAVQGRTKQLRKAKEEKESLTNQLANKDNKPKDSDGAPAGTPGK